MSYHVTPLNGILRFLTFPVGVWKSLCNTTIGLIPEANTGLLAMATALNEYPTWLRQLDGGKTPSFQKKIWFCKAHLWKRAQITLCSPSVGDTILASDDKSRSWYDSTLLSLFLLTGSPSMNHKINIQLNHWHTTWRLHWPLKLGRPITYSLKENITEFTRSSPVYPRQESAFFSDRNHVLETWLLFFFGIIVIFFFTFRLNVLFTCLRMRFMNRLLFHC